MNPQVVQDLQIKVASLEQEVSNICKKLLENQAKEESKEAYARQGSVPSWNNEEKLSRKNIFGQTLRKFKS